MPEVYTEPGPTKQEACTRGQHAAKTILRGQVKPSEAKRSQAILHISHFAPIPSSTPTPPRTSLEILFQSLPPVLFTICPPSTRLLRRRLCSSVHRTGSAGRVRPCDDDGDALLPTPLPLPLSPPQVRGVWQGGGAPTPGAACVETAGV